MNHPTKGDLWRHYKGGLYHITAVGRHETTQEPVIVYTSLKDDSVWVRPTSQFMSSVDENGYIPRFTKVED